MNSRSADGVRVKVVVAAEAVTEAELAAGGPFATRNVSVNCWVMERPALIEVVVEIEFAKVGSPLTGAVAAESIVAVARAEARCDGEDCCSLLAADCAIAALSIALVEEFSETLWTMIGRALTPSNIPPTCSTEL